jgi:hypothetical protein
LPADADNVRVTHAKGPPANSTYNHHPYKFLILITSAMLKQKNPTDKKVKS